jgi:DNA-binding GntR family transcriptional regulator
MALVDCQRLPELAGRIDVLAGRLIAAARDPQIISAIDRALHSSQQFPSFLNLEYYDLADFLKQLLDAAESPEIERTCRAVLKLLQQRVIVYERHTSDRQASGLSIYLSNPLVPQNIFEAHQAMYRNCRFSRDTRWDEWVGVFRTSWKKNPPGRKPSR